MHQVNNFDASGVQLSELIAEELRSRGGGLYFSGVNTRVFQVFKNSDLLRKIGDSHVHTSTRSGIRERCARAFARSSAWHVNIPCLLNARNLKKETGKSCQGRASPLHAHAGGCSRREKECLVKILVVVDESPSAFDALRAAAAITARLGAELWVLVVSSGHPRHRGSTAGRRRHSHGRARAVAGRISDLAQGCRATGAGRFLVPPASVKLQDVPQGYLAAAVQPIGSRVMFCERFGNFIDEATMRSTLTTMTCW